MSQDPQFSPVPTCMIGTSVDIHEYHPHPMFVVYLNAVIDSEGFFSDIQYHVYLKIFGIYKFLFAI